MKHMGDYDASTVIYGKFTTFRPSTGAAFTLGGTPALSVYKDNSTTQSTTGVTLTADFDSVTGLNHFAIDTSADGAFYTAGSFFDVVITTGTVDSVSVVGTVVASFTIRKDSSLKPTTAGRTLDVTATGEAGIDWANIGSPTTTVNLSGTTVKTATDVETDTADIQSRLPAALVSGRIDASVGAMAANVLTASALATDAVNEIADGVWDEALSGHLSAGSTGEALNAAGAAGDPWTTTLPGAYGAGSAGYIVGNNLNAPVGTVDTVVDAIKAVTDNLPDSGALTTITNNVAAILADTGTDGVVVAAGSKTGYSLSATQTFDLTGNITGNLSGSVGSLTTNNDKTGYALSATGSAALTEGYAALGAAGTLPQILYEIRALLAEKSISSTTLTTKKLDGTTTAATYTLDDATTPSAITRAT